MLRITERLTAGSKFVRGSELSPELRKEVLQRWTNRHYSKPGKQWISDDDVAWLARHKFLITAHNRLDYTTKMCEPITFAG